MSPRAAWRLESLGFAPVSDYAPGKVDWFAAGLPMEGLLAEVLRVGQLAERDVPTCGLQERIEVVRDRAREAGWNLSVVVNEERVVLGIVRKGALERDPDAIAAEAMTSGPSTFRPNVSCHEMFEYMKEHDLQGALITTADGVLVGLLRRAECLRREKELRPLQRTGQWPVKGW